jgi:hypothetical protein
MVSWNSTTGSRVVMVMMMMGSTSWTIITVGDCMVRTQVLVFFINAQHSIYT